MEDTAGGYGGYGGGYGRARSSFITTTTIDIGNEKGRRGIIAPPAFSFGPLTYRSRSLCLSR